MTLALPAASAVLSGGVCIFFSIKLMSASAASKTSGQASGPDAWENAL